MKILRYTSLNSVNYKWVKIAFKKVLIKKAHCKKYFQIFNDVKVYLII